jgi:HPt (histidine-containing phosphotransfer) domain-containing protein
LSDGNQNPSQVELNLHQEFHDSDSSNSSWSGAGENIFEGGKKINLTYLKQIAEGNDAFIIEMIEMFLNKTPEALEKLNESFKNRNWKEVKQIAHKIKPSYGYIGMPDVQSALAQIETLSDTEAQPEKVHELMTEVIRDSRSAFDQLKQELNGLR